MLFGFLKNVMWTTVFHQAYEYPLVAECIVDEQDVESEHCLLHSVEFIPQLNFGDAILFGLIVIWNV
jgi:hypothetical protein